MRNLVMIAGLVAAAWTTPVLAESSVWDGVYTGAQADRGAAKYKQECAVCHGPVLEGNGEAPPLVGHFIPDWAGTKLSDVYDKIQMTMPLFAPATLSATDTADLLAFILQANNFPAGSKELAAGDGLKLISFDVTKPMAKETKPKKRH